MNGQVHAGELELRRLRAGELDGARAEALTRHTSECELCRAKLRGLDDEQRRFETAVSFDRFAAGVTRAQRRPAPPRAFWTHPGMGIAAAVLVLLAVPYLWLRPGDLPVEPNRTKGGSAEIVLRIAGASGTPQRTASASAPEALGPGEQVRIGYKPGGHRYVLSISIDASGEVSPLHPADATQSLPTVEGDDYHYLPDALEFTGHGAERVIVVLSDEPLQMTRVQAAARAAFEAAGRDLSRLGTLELPGEQLQRTVLKP